MFARLALIPLLAAATLTALPESIRPASAQMLYENFDPNGERTGVSGPYARYQTHILKFSARRYAVLFKPGYVDAQTAIRAVKPLCAAQGLIAAGQGEIAPVDLVRVEGRNSVHQGYRVHCVKAANS